MAFDKLAQQDFSIGLELPLDNDWSASGRPNGCQKAARSVYLT